MNRDIIIIPEQAAVGIVKLDNYKEQELKKVKYPKCTKMFKFRIGKSMNIQSNNEWDPLKSIILGDVQKARFPKYDDVFNEVAKHSKWTEISNPKVH